ncbi:hypothetical protein [Nocardia goodfellowii]|uniref:Uncharacterized protein n=1 Tax=Nocardia goodfellowii TaxID=882446 RepID=A0ABS4QGS2_9NOCA|nr:hypothetical protein [Nocardia goodfellowii]MBP2190298.1 hypothetical protein [Nocardia goodfellowii]
MTTHAVTTRGTGVRRAESATSSMRTRFARLLALFGAAGQAVPFHRG